MPDETVVFAGGPGLAATLSAQRTRFGIEEVTHAHLGLARPSEADFTAVRDRLDESLRHLAVTAMPLVALLLTRPARRDLLVPPFLPPPPVPLTCSSGHRRSGPSTSTPARCGHSSVPRWSADPGFPVCCSRSARSSRRPGADSTRSWVPWIGTGSTRHSASPGRRSTRNAATGADVPNRDLILLETVKTHRARLASAFVFGELTRRRLANDNVRRLIGGIIAAAVLCVGCIGFSFVSGLLGSQAAAKQAQAGMGPATGTAFVADTFDRTTERGWGTAELGGPWTTLGPRGDYAAAGGVATTALPENEVRGGYLGRQLQDRSDVTVTVRRTTGARDGTVAVAVVGRRVSSSQDYRANVILGADGSVALNLSRRADPTRPDEPAEVSLSDTVILLGPGSDPNPTPRR